MKRVLEAEKKDMNRCELFDPRWYESRCHVSTASAEHVIPGGRGPGDGGEAGPSGVSMKGRLMTAVRRSMDRRGRVERRQME